MALRRFLVSGLALALTLTGCQRPIATFPVEGKVTFEGKPMRGGGSISFLPMADQPGKTAAGEIDEAGNYRLMTHQPGDGSMVGDFRVVIVQVTEREPKRTRDGERAQQGTVVVQPAERIPLSYADPTASPLTAKVEARERNVIDFNLRK